MALLATNGSKATLNAIKMRVDDLHVRVSLIESKQLADGLAFKEYAERKERDEINARAEWEKFATKSADDRARLHKDNETLRKEMWESNMVLLWRVIAAMFTIFTTAAGIVAALIHNGTLH